MPSALKPLLMTMRLLVLVLLVLGAMIWLGHGDAVRGAHVGLGFVLALVLVAVGVVGWRATRGAAPLLLALGGALGMVGYGLPHGRLMAGSAHWVAQVIHVLIGLGTIGIAESIAARVRRAGQGARGPGF